MLFGVRLRGGRAVGGKSSSRLYRVSHCDEADVHCAQYFVTSSLSPVLLFRRRLKSVADVLKGYRSKGFTQSRWDALLRYWGAVCRHGPCCPISSLDPWDKWILPDLHGFYKWVFDSLELFGIRKWACWLREDLSSKPYVWRWPDFVPPSPFLVVTDPQAGSSRFWLNLILSMPSFVKLGCPFSVGRVILLSLLISFWTLLVISCLRRLIWIFLGLLGG